MALQLLMNHLHSNGDVGGGRSGRSSAVCCPQHQLHRIAVHSVSVKFSDEEYSHWSFYGQTVRNVLQGVDDLSILTNVRIGSLQRILLSLRNILYPNSRLPQAFASWSSLPQPLSSRRSVRRLACYHWCLSQRLFPGSLPISLKAQPLEEQWRKCLYSSPPASVALTMRSNLSCSSRSIGTTERNSPSSEMANIFAPVPRIT